LLYSNIFAQNGYQEYTFGMGIDTIISKFPNNIKEWGYYYNGLFYIIKHLYDSELSGNIPNPLAATGDKFKVLLTGSDLRDSDFAFLFYDNKLVGMMTFFNNDNILPEIIRKYGNGSKYGVSWNGRTSEEGFLWLNSQRFIIWEERTGNYNTKYQIVTYFDVNFARELCRRKMDTFRAEQEKVKSRLD
jgi:hypothetical protein